jgi:phosphopantothenoylcysteine decarboxylase/phosphopantothenate--cysteine ligase
VRVISNISSGVLGQTIALSFAQAGAKVTLMEGPVIKPLKSTRVKVLKFSFFDELHQLMEKELKKDYPVVVHAAAVADYKLLKPSASKIDSHQKKVMLELIPTPKLINGIKKFNPGTVLVGFKLEPRISGQLAVEKSRRLFQEAGCDFVVANRVGKEGYEGYILDREGAILAHETTRQGISLSLIKIMNALL